MKYLDDNGASRLLDVIKAYADRKVAEVDLREGGSVGGPLKVTSGKFDQVEIGKINNPYLSPSILLKVGEGGIWSQGPIISMTSVETVNVTADTARFKRLLDVSEGAIIAGSTSLDQVSMYQATVLGAIGGANNIWSISATGDASLSRLEIDSGLSVYGLATFDSEVGFSEPVTVNNILRGSGWAVTTTGYAKFNRILDISQYYQISNIEELEENVVSAVLETFRLGPGMQTIEPDKIRVLGYFEAGNSLAFIRFTVGFLIDPSSCNFAPGADKIIGARLTADGETVLMIPVFDSPAPIGFFEYSLPFNPTNGSFLAAAKYKLEVVLGSSSQ